MNLKQQIEEIRSQQGIGRRGGLVVKTIDLDAQDIQDLGQLKTATSRTSGKDYSYYDVKGTRVFPARDEKENILPATVGQVLEVTRGEYNGNPVLNFNIYA